MDGTVSAWMSYNGKILNVSKCFKMTNIHTHCSAVINNY